MTADLPPGVAHTGGAVHNIGQTGLVAGERARHRNRGWATFHYFDGREDSVVEFDDGDWARVTTTSVRRPADPG